MIIPILASKIATGDTLTDSEGLYTRIVFDIDTMSNVNGKIIIRTGRTGSGSTVVNPDTILHVSI